MVELTTSLPLFETYPDVPPVAVSAPPQNNPAALWLAVYLPKLCLEILQTDHQQVAAAIIVQRGGRDFVHSVSLPAEKRGVLQGMTLSAACALCPDLVAHSLDKSAQQQRLEKLADVALRFSSQVIVCPADALLIEVQGSEQYFGGIAAIQRGIAEILSGEWRHSFYFSVSPTPAASLLLARTGSSATVRKPEDLRSALGGIPVAYLPLDKKRRQQLKNTGVRVLRDVWRLPTEGLAKRFGQAFTDYLKRVLGEFSDPRETFKSTLFFCRRREFSYAVENLQFVTPSAHELLGELSDFLREHDLCVNQYELRFFHECADASKVRVDVRSSSRGVDDLFMLLQTRLETMAIPAPVVGVELYAENVSRYSTYSENLFEDLPAPADTNRFDSSMDSLLDQLRLRLGEEALVGLVPLQDHRPEYAQNHSTLLIDNRENAGGAQTPTIDNSRPLWLLDTPLPLQLIDGAIWYRSPATFFSGPERIESGWWDSEDIRRDYYRAVDKRGCRLWIYRELTGGRQWYLHGLFG
jgi:protein ImuB